jgi:malonyl CoA-acyl carrier protein transacylase/acyl carrier protein
VGLIEAHGTGTPVGDATEVQALTTVFGRREGALPWCGLGSVKSMIGHAMPAAGIAGIIKTALALYHRVLPPTLNVERPNPKLGLESTPFYLNTETRPWIHGNAEAPRRGGVNAFGFGGINAHALLEEAHAASDSLMPWESEVVILTGRTRDELLRRVREIETRTESIGDFELRDLAASINVPLGEGDARLAIVASDVDDLREKLRVAGSRLADSNVTRLRDARGIYFAGEPLARDKKVAFLFPGEGSQYLGMLSDLCTHFPDVRRRFDFIDEVFRGHQRSYVPSDFIFPRPMFSPEEEREAEARLWQMEGAFEAVLTADWALYELLRTLGIAPDAMLGHSTGEYAAMRAAGMMKLETDADVARFARELNDFYYRQGAREAVAPSDLIAVGADSAAVSEALRAVSGSGGEIFLAMDNCPHQAVVVGRRTEMERFLEEVQRRGWIYERLSFDRPYHTPAFEAYCGGLRDFLSEWIVRPPACELYSCASASRFPDGISDCLELALKHWMSPVEFRKTIEKMYDEGVRIFVEVGPRGNLSAFVDDTLRGRLHLAVPVDSFSRPGIAQLNHFVGLLAVHGVPMNLDALYRGRRVRPMPAGATPEKRRPMKVDVGWIPMGMSEEMAAKLRAKEPAAASPPRPVAAGPAISPAVPPSNGTHLGTKVHAALPSPGPTSVAPKAGTADAVMTSYWKTMERFLAVQQEVMEGFLAGRPTASPEVVSPPPRHREEATILEEPPVAARPAAVDVPEVPPATSQSDGTRELLLKIVSERTGYPVEMIGLDLDLEADLGIDSIKRVEILGSLQQQSALVSGDDMESLSAQKTLGDVIRYLEARSNGSARSSAPRSRPFLRFIEKHIPGEELSARAVLDLREDLFLRDHALGRRVSSSDPELTGLPVVPLTMGMEMLAEAALALAPDADRKVIGMRDVRAHRWMMLDGGELSIQILARKVESREGLVVQVKVFEGPGTPGAAPVVEGKVVLAERYPDPPAAAGFELASERESKWAPENLYEEIMFHGPRFQGVRSMDRWGADGATASLRTLSPGNLFASTRSPALATDPVLLDQPGQVVGFWTAEHLEHGYVVFPFQLDALDLYRAPGTTPEALECRARIRLVGDEAVDSDLDVVARENGAESLVCRFSGWKDRRFDLPRAFLRFLHDPVAVTLTESVAQVRGGYRLRLRGFPGGFFTAHGAVWQKALAMLILGRNERRAWYALTPSPTDRVGWLLERLAAKDAARAWLREKAGNELSPADIELQSEEPGRFLARGPGGVTLSVAVSKDGDDFVAVAVESGRFNTEVPEPALGETRK